MFDMAKQDNGKFYRLAAFAGLAMALCPLTALTLNSLDSEPPAATPDTAMERSLKTHDTMRQVSAEYAGKRVSDVAAGSGSVDLFNRVLRDAGVDALLRDSSQVTVFMPVNEAFAERSVALSDKPEEAAALAKAHIVEGRVTATDLMGRVDLRSLNGNPITAQAGTGLQVNGATVIASEEAGNGIVHFVDRLL
jgi:uncharacterized surface protein with fasciclin (FAS1) repeats